MSNFLLGKKASSSGVKVKWIVPSANQQRLDALQSTLSNTAAHGYMKREDNPFSMRGIKWDGGKGAKIFAERAKARVYEKKRWQQEMQTHAGNEQWAAVRAGVAQKRQQIQAKKQKEIARARTAAATKAVLARLKQPRVTTKRV